MIILHSVLIRIRNVSDIAVEKVDTQFYFQYSISENCAIYENVENYGRGREAKDDNTV
jgi:hypothetical protein